ncbi:MAG: hypothetical protein RIB45_00425 [Marivibrio sp.]|uniref:hypothetical protein n=1 Tax=Marivibrio sp. TaxID=2039719 RepID=UPI0032EDCA32
MRRLITLLAALAAFAPAPAAAHVAERGMVMLLPTDYYLVGGALAVAASFLMLLLAPARAPKPPEAARAPGESAAPLSWLSFALLLLLLAAGLAGTRDPLLNPLPIAVWTGLWVALTLAHALLGDLWAWINPWSGPVRLVRRLIGPAPLRLPPWLGRWPAIVTLLAFAWFELVDVAPDDPERLAVAAGLYWLFTFATMLLVGEREWARRGEFLSVFFGFIALLAPVRRTAGGGVGLTWPGAKIFAAPAPSPTAALFVLTALSTVSFDGLNKTFWWLDLIGINPLDFPGRSAVMIDNTLGLLGAAAALSGAYFLAVWIGDRLAGGDGRGLIRTDAGRGGALALSLLPISLAYHFSHYLTALLVNAQYGLVAITDPFATGADWLGVAEMHVVTSFLMNRESVEAIWNLQAGAIVIGHVWAVGLAHFLALAHYGSARRAALSQIPLAGLMVGYTVFGLWLLSTPTGA